MLEATEGEIRTLIEEGAKNLGFHSGSMGKTAIIARLDRLWTLATHLPDDAAPEQPAA